MIKVSATSRTAAVAGAIAGVVREQHRAEVQAIGAGAVNQAMKALILATGYLREDGIYVSCVPEFAEVTIEDKVRTAIKLVIEPMHSSDLSEGQESLFMPRSKDRASNEKHLDANIRNENSAFSA
jgi:stage V sporulation protein S